MTDNEVSIKVTGQNTSQPAVDGARRGMKGLKDEAGETSVKVRVLGDSVKGTTRATDDLGDKARKTAREVSALDRKILELRASTLALGRQFEQTGDSSLLKKFRSDSRELSGLERMRKQMSGLAGDVASVGKEAASTASTFTQLFQGGIINALKSPTGMAVAAPAVAGTAILAGATAGGVLTAGVGAGVAGAGIAGAAMQSEKVRNEWARTTAEIKEQFLDATTSFEGPTISAIGKVRSAFADIDMKKIFGDASKFVDPLAEGAAKFVRLTGQGVEYMVARAGPAIVAISDGVAEVGGAIKIALEKVSDGSEGGTKALNDVAGAISDLIILTGTWIGWLEDAYDAVDDLSQEMRVLPQVDLMAKLFDPDDPKVIARRLDDVSTAADKTAGSIRYLTGGLADMTSEARLANDAFDRLFGIMMDVDTANVAVKLGMAGLRDALKDEGATRDELTEKVLRQIQLLQEQRDAQLATGDGSQAATDQINANYKAQLEQLKKMFPWLDGLIAKYEELAKDRTSHIDIIVQEKRIGSVSVEGVISGGDQRRNTGKGFASGGIAGAASGMVVSGGVDVGEQGRELALLAPGRAVLPPGSQVIPNGTTENMLSRGGQGGAISVVLETTGGGGGDALVEVINTLINGNRLRLKVINNRVVAA